MVLQAKVKSKKECSLLYTEVCTFSSLLAGNKLQVKVGYHCDNLRLYLIVKNYCIVFRDKNVGTYTVLV